MGAVDSTGVADVAHAGIQIAAMVFGAQAFKHLDVWEFMGFKQVWKYITRREVSGDIDGLTRQGLVTTGV